MNEDLLHYVWKYNLFKSFELNTLDGEEIQIVNQGIYNNDAGPDFINAKIKIGNTLWAGNVEIHIKSSDWIKHNHTSDEAYKNIILHVVYENDVDISDLANHTFPTLQLRNNIREDILNNYNKIKLSQGWIACENYIKEIDEFIINKWLERILIERLQNRTKDIKLVFKENNNNWEETFYQLLAANFGFKVNKTPFEMLAKSLPQKYLAKHKNNLFQIEALLFGQSGLLNEQLKEDYPVKLLIEYNFLRQKFDLDAIEPHIWRFMRIRPSNFPTIRISQFANLISRSNHLFSLILEAKSIKELTELFSIKASSYWKDHYTFGKVTKGKIKQFGESSLNNIIINTIVPVLFAYGDIKNDDTIKQRAIDHLFFVKKENNSIIKNWESIGMQNNNAADSQALLELKKNYCNTKMCLKCQIGNVVLKSA